MEVVLSRIHQREAAAVKRERTMAYAFSHQVCSFLYDSLGYIVFTLFISEQESSLFGTLCHSGEPIPTQCLDQVSMI